MKYDLQEEETTLINELTESECNLSVFSQTLVQ